MNRFRALIGIAALLLLAACGGTSTTEGGATPNGAPAPPDVTFFNAAHLVPGDGSPTIDEAIFIVDAGKLTNIGKKGDFQPAKGAGRTDLKEQTGTASATVIPALINVSGFPGLSSGQSFGASNYTHDSVIDDLKRYEYYGVFAVASGGADSGDLSLKIRDEQREGKAQGATYYTSGPAITAKGGYPANTLKGAALEVGSEDEARKAVNDLAGKKVDFIKLFVNGSPKLSPAVFKAVIDEAKKANLKVFADAPALADAKELVNAGVSGLVNSITDGNVDDALISAMKEKNVFYAPALTALEAKFVYADSPKWLGEQFMKEVYPVQLSAYLANTVTVNKFKRNPAIGTLRAQYSTAQKNLKKLSDGGVKIALGSGSGSQDTYPGYFEHRELELMVDAGMTPIDAIKAGTTGSAEALGLTDMGALAMGKAGNFIVTANNPAAEIADTKTAQQIYWKGSRVEQGALVPQIDITKLKVSDEDKKADIQATQNEELQKRIAAMKHYGPWPAGKSATVRGLSIPTPYGTTAAVQAGPPDKITINNQRGSAADWRGFYGAALPAWKAAGNCWERQHPVNKKTETLCVEPAGNSAVVQITEK